MRRKPRLWKLEIHEPASLKDRFAATLSISMSIQLREQHVRILEGRWASYIPGREKRRPGDPFVVRATPGLRGRLILQGKNAYLLLLLTAGASLAAAQQAASPAGVPAANPARPTVSTPATLTPVGFLQFENGGMNAWHSPEFSTQLNFNEVVKVAVSSRLELMAVTEPVARSKAAGKIGTAPAGTLLAGKRFSAPAKEPARPLPRAICAKSTVAQRPTSTWAVRPTR